MPAHERPAFISYSRDDSEFALRLAHDLKAAGASVWLDQLDIPLGHPWDNAIEDALSDAPQMLIVLSPSSARSDNVRNEISFALEQGKVIIPVLHVDCVVPLRLQRTQRVDFRTDYARGLTALLQYLHVTPAGPSTPQSSAEARENNPRAAEEAERRDPGPAPLSGAAQVDFRRPVAPSWWQQVNRQAPLILSALIVVLIVVLVSFLRPRKSESTQDKPGGAAQQLIAAKEDSENRQPQSSPNPAANLSPPSAPIKSASPQQAKEIGLTTQVLPRAKELDNAKNTTAQKARQGLNGQNPPSNVSPNATTAVPPQRAPMLTETETYYSAVAASGACGELGALATVCTPAKPEGWTIKDRHFELKGDRTACGPGDCEIVQSASPERACYSFKTKGRPEECTASGKGVHFSIGVLTIDWEHP